MVNIFKKLNIVCCAKEAAIKDIKYVRSHAQAIGQCPKNYKKK